MNSLSKSTIANDLGDISEVLETTPELNNYPLENWEKTHNMLAQEGFKKFAYMISNNPKLLMKSQDKLFKAINSWRGFQFGEKNTIALLERYPELLEIEPNMDVMRKIGALKRYVGGDKNVFKVLMISPSVVTCSLSVLEEKIDYLQNVMKIEAPEVTKSDAFSSDIMKIKTRYAFLQRLGMYQIKKKKDLNEPSKNPNLYQITDTSDKRFATKVCHVTLDEYETFLELYKKELDEKNDTADYDSDGNDEFDDDDSYIDFGHHRV